MRVERGGKHGYKHVRGGQGRSKNKFQGVSPKKTNRTDLFDSPREAAVAYARMLTARVRERQQLPLGSILRSRPLNIDFGMAASNLVMPAVRPIGPIDRVRTAQLGASCSRCRARRACCVCTREGAQPSVSVRSK